VAHRPTPWKIVLATCLLIAACKPAPVSVGNEGWQPFTLGTMPLMYADKKEHRYLVSVPRRYLHTKLLPDPIFKDAAGRIIANDIRFGVEYPSIKPATDPWANGSIRVTIGAYQEDGISRTVDGGALSHYSIYSKDLPEAFGLHVRRREDRYPFPDRLYFRIAADLHIRIECKGNVHRSDLWCIMDARRPGEPLVTTGFYSSELPHWRTRWERLHALFRSEGRGALVASRETYEQERQAWKAAGR